MNHRTDSRYLLRFPEELCRIDPDFTEHWLLPYFTEDGFLDLPRDEDLSALERYVCADLTTLEQRLGDLFRSGELTAMLNSVPPLTDEELDGLLPQLAKGDPDALSRIGETYLQTIVSILCDYCPNEQILLQILPEVYRHFESFLKDSASGLPDNFRGHALWQIRYAAIRQLWAIHAKNTYPGSDRLRPEYRLRHPDGPIFAQPGEKVPAVALSSTPLAEMYRYLRRQHPDLFRELQDFLIPREWEILELVLEENCLLTFHDAADRFSVSYERIMLTLRRLIRLIRTPGICEVLQSAGFPVRSLRR